MAVVICTDKCPHLRSLRYGFDGKTRLVGACYDRRDRFATCALRPEVTIDVRTQPGCVATRERKEG